MKSRKRVWIPEAEEKKIVVELQCHITFQGFFEVELIDSATGRVKRRAIFENLITDDGLDALGDGSSEIDDFSWMAVGTDGTTPSTSDTSLGAEVDRVNTEQQHYYFHPSPDIQTSWSSSYHSSISGDSISGSYWEFRRRRAFLESEGNGNLTEIGILDAGSLGNLLLRTLFKDSSGTPIVFTKTSSDQLLITHHIRAFPQHKVTSGTFTIGATTHSWSASALDVDRDLVWGRNPYTQGFGFLEKFGTWTDITAYASVSASKIIHPTGSGGNFGTFAAQSEASSAIAQTYSPGNFYRDVTYAWGAGSANFGPGGVPGIVVAPWRTSGAQANGMAYQILIDPPIPKTSDDILTLKVRHSWSRQITKTE